MEVVMHYTLTLEGGQKIVLESKRCDTERCARLDILVQLARLRDKLDQRLNELWAQGPGHRFTDEDCTP